MLGCARIYITESLEAIKMVMVDPEENKLQLLGYLLQMKLQKGIYSEEELVPLKRGGVSASSSLGKFINLDSRPY